MAEVGGVAGDRLRTIIERIERLEDEKKALDLVREFKSYVKKDEIESTPTFVINGIKYSNRSFEELKEIIEKNLSN